MVHLGIMTLIGRVTFRAGFTVCCWLSGMYGQGHVMIKCLQTDPCPACLDLWKIKATS